MLIDIHSHLKEKTENYIRIFNYEPEKCQVCEFLDSIIDESIWLSVGIHPWHASEWSESEVLGLSNLFDESHVLFIGEIGLDKNCSVTAAKQMEIFMAQAALADSLKKPVIIHVVREMERLLESKKMFPNIPAWIVHGFRGGKQEAKQYVDKGFCLSFGSRFRSDGLMACSENNIFVETDESRKSLIEIYTRIAAERKIDVRQLEILVEQNFMSIFPQGHRINKMSIPKRF